MSNKDYIDFEEVVETKPKAVDEKPKIDPNASKVLTDITKETLYKDATVDQTASIAKEYATQNSDTKAIEKDILDGIISLDGSFKPIWEKPKDKIVEPQTLAVEKYDPVRNISAGKPNENEPQAKTEKAVIDKIIMPDGKEVNLRKDVGFVRPPENISTKELPAGPETMALTSAGGGRDGGAYTQNQTASPSGERGLPGPGNIPDAKTTEPKKQDVQAPLAKHQSNQGEEQADSKPPAKEERQTSGRGKKWGTVFRGTLSFLGGLVSTSIAFGLTIFNAANGQDVTYTGLQIGSGIQSTLGQFGDLVGKALTPSKEFLEKAAANPAVAEVAQNTQNFSMNKLLEFEMYKQMLGGRGGQMPHQLPGIGGAGGGM